MAGWKFDKKKKKKSYKVEILSSAGRENRVADGLSERADERQKKEIVRPSKRERERELSKKNNNPFSHRPSIQLRQPIHSLSKAFIEWSLRLVRGRARA